ncbi:hypothetical protein KSF_102100 [Reticulibacter mediterranei]|uniref:Uncharacterized protein n=1 Tax=Reticulibacter mediterranei TaxID=2778369 RepID=A0A8J3N6A4_9CHLR|nr:hypothetical protein [Reticulibacter mediterranei]GHP00163.1 hypothetical protein KSF_102100 [Reticulibacter mediterranei]
MYRSLLNVLSVWQDKETAQLVGIALLKQFDALERNQEQDKAAVLKALARLTHMQPTLIESLRISLSQKSIAQSSTPRTRTDGILGKGAALSKRRSESLLRDRLK